MNRLLHIFCCLVLQISALAQEDCDSISIITNERISYELCNDSLIAEISIINNEFFQFDSCLWVSNLNSEVVVGYDFPLEVYSNEFVDIIIVATDINGCSSSKFINFNVENGLHIDSISPFLPVSNPFCSIEYRPSDFISSIENTNYNYNWIVSGNGIIDTIFNDYSAAFITSGSIDLGLSITDIQQECTLEWDLHEGLEILKSPDIELTSLESSYCGTTVEPIITNIAINDSAFGNLTYQWSLEYYDELISESAESSFNFTQENNGLYQVLLEVENQTNLCTTVDSFLFTVEDLNLNFDFPSLPQCSEFSFLPMNFTSDSIDTEVTYQWEIRDNLGATLHTSSSNNPIFLMNTAGVFDLYLNINSSLVDSNCSFTTLIEDAITIYANPDLILSTGDTILCDTLSTLNIIENNYQSSISEIESLEWILTKELIPVESSSNPNFEYAFNAVGSYLLDLTTTRVNGCISSDEISISVHDVSLSFEEITPRVECYLDTIAPSEYLSSYSLGSNVSYLWSLTEESEEIIYEDLIEFDGTWNLSNAGVFDLSILASENGCFYGDTLEEYITVKILDASIVSNINNCAILPTTIEISNNSHIDQSLSPNFDWTFTHSDGDTLSSSFLELPSIELDTSELINVSLTLSADGCTNTATLIDSVGIGYLIAKLDTFNHIASNCLPYSFSAAQINLLPVNSLFEYEWMLTHPNGIDSNVSNTSEGNFEVNESGAYDLHLMITDDNNCTDEISIPDFVLMNRYELVIAKTDNNSCFNSINLQVDSLDKFFFLDSFIPEQNFPMVETDFDWIIQSFEGNILPYSETQDTARFIMINPGEYKTFYTKTLDYGNCQYTDSIHFTVGVIADISDINPGLFSLQGENGENSICLGKEFPLNQNTSIGIGPNSNFTWTSDTAFFISNTTAGETTFVGQVEGVFDISMSVINDSLCLDTITKTIEIYDLNPTFNSPNIPEQCIGESIRLDSENNYFINQFDWEVSQQNYLNGDSSITPLPSLPVPFTYYTSEEITFDIDIELSITSIHGCTKSLKLNDMIDVVGPLPKFVIENEDGCDSITTKIIDLSDSNLIDTFSMDYGNNDTSTYILNDTIIQTYTFPYPIELLEGDSCYFYQINLAADYHSCLDTFKGEVRLYPNPILNIQSDITIGCDPMEVEFENLDIYAPEESSDFFWYFDFGPTQVELSSSTNPNPTHTYNIKKEYSIFHSATTSFGCYSEDTWENLIELFNAPVAEFEVLRNRYCYDMGNAIYQNNSTHDSDSLINSWIYEDGESNQENLAITYDSTAFYDIYLHILDSNGCSDSVQKSVFIEVLDTIVALPIMHYVTTQDYGIEVFWTDSVDDNFDNINLYHETNFAFWENIYDSYDILPNQYSQNNSNPYQNNYYTMVQQDSCGYFSDSSMVHSPILLKLESTDYGVIRLDWSAYQGWASVESYDIYRSIEGDDFEYLDQISGNSVSYQDSNLCNVRHYYYVVANHPEENILSRSNKANLVPLFTDFSSPIYIEYSSVFTTVQGDDVIVTEWPVISNNAVSYYKISRWDEYFGWVEYDTVALEPPFVDFNVNVQASNYKYRVQYRDVCGNIGPVSNYGENILLKGEKFHPSHIDLNWNPYKEWIEGVGEYKIQFYNQIQGFYQDIRTVSGTTLELKNIPLSDYGVDSSYCYRVIATNFQDPTIKSHSNKRCFIGLSSNAWPNAFSPNNDGINDTYKFGSKLSKALDVNIYNRWGNLVFTSEDVYFEWDGTDSDSGQECPQGTYVLRYALKSFDGSIITNEKVVLLVR